MLDNQCSHGIKWTDDCAECNLSGARETVRHFGPMVDEARRVIEAAEHTEEVKT
ncbi:hypothetical protein NDK50_08290 [Paraburkholderia bryophila]|uniref:hypothetical protein n=1 Tax=Paraburkholderia bryophila TaxID=420952 RepID=UPI00234B760F|nr:hypothetical protein [Paraburkholderia bryophila]WCM21436.1 hypothetical protein NDK50_08290 [Paraburkholderia bryophila]